MDNRQPTTDNAVPHPLASGAPTPDNGQPTTDHVRWPLLYAAVLGELALLIVIFYAFTKAFS